MLIAVRLILAAQEKAELPPALGRANYAAVLARLARVYPELAAAVHDGDGPKPLTCSGLLREQGNNRQQVVVAGERVSVRVTGLQEDVSKALAACLVADRPQSWQLDYCNFRVDDVVCDSAVDPWTGTVLLGALARRYLVHEGDLSPTVRLEFASPTAFKSAGMTVPVPMPGLVFGSLVERWNTFSPVPLSPDMRRFGEEVMAISQYNLRSVPVTQKNQALRIGGLGEVTYRAMSSDRYWLGVMHMLADFAQFSGVGVQTATGMGQVRRMR